MGNQLVGIAPSQILSVDSYFSDIHDYEYDKSLGSTRFFKVARAKHKEGLVVVKVFAIQDPSLPLTSYKQELEELKIRLHSCQNCLPFQKATLTEKAAILFRQYVRDNLYDRISTRPFLNNVEKKWIAFQLLNAVDQAHKSGVRHGDIKTENVMVTSWNWVLLTDFASFKPTYLPEDNPADFNYFFDTSRRRTCYIAPERFVDGSMFATESDQTTPLVDLSSNSQRTRGELKQPMDIFSAGCVIAELFTEGVPLFDLSQLLAYRKGHFQTEQVLMKIEDRSIRELVAQMVQREPEKRLTAEEYLKQQRGKAFPEIFYTFLQPYMAQFAKETFQSADERVLVIRKNLENILNNLCSGGQTGKTEKQEKESQELSSKEQGLVVLVSVITSCLQTLRYCDSKLAALELILHLAGRLNVEIVLDRITPYLLHFCNDSMPRVRAEAVRTLTKVLALVKEVPRNDVNIYPEYILPGIAHLAQDEATIVRLAYAENIAHLAETALRFLELVQENNLSSEQDLNGEDTEETLPPNENYDSELQALHEMVQQKVVTLLSDPENIVKQTLMENGITRLCVFFGRQKANDVLLSHMITFLNDKNDWHLRGAFFDSIVGVAAYVGWQSSSILKPLLQQGLSDAEEFVIYKALNALTCMCQLGLLQKPHIYEFVSDIAPFLCHPNLWIRYGAVGFITVVAQHLNIADVYCKLMPHLSPFITQPIIQIDKEIVLLSVLKEPISRSIFDYALRSKDIGSLFRHLLLRQKKRNGSIPECPIPEDPAIAQLLKKLLSQGMTEAEEDKLLALKDFMLKSNKAKANIIDQSHLSDGAHSGVIDLGTVGITGRQVDLIKPKQEFEDKRDVIPSASARKHTKQDSNLNEEWKSMFGSLDPPSSAQTPSTIPESGAIQPKKTTGVPIIQVVQSVTGTSTYQRRITTCKAELQQLVQQKREQCNAERMAKQMMESAEWESKPPPPGWHPKGLLVAHLHEHKSAVNRIRVSDEHSIFATCSNDGTVKIWDSQKMEGKTTTTRSVLTYSRIGGHVKTLTFCQGSHYLAVASDNGSIQLLAVEANKPPKSPKVQPCQTRFLDPKDEGCAVDVHHFNSGAQTVLAYATVNGFLVGWDLRSNSNAWTLRHDLRLGLITSFAVDMHQCWLCVGTSNGTMACWDMRFQLPISSHSHPARARIRRLQMHPLYQSSVIAAVQGNNEVSMWDMETGDRKFTLWASSAPPLSEMQPSPHSVHGIYCSPADGNPLLLTAGSDMRIRFWDLAYPERSYIVAGCANDSLHCPSVFYNRKIIEGTEVVQEIHSKQKSGSTEDTPRRGPESLPVGHHDIITDIATFQTTQGFIVTSSRDGIVKVWK
ncbi:phosphoinositide 3-kinase regulatory subunit 4 isoform X1 [Carassius auratus]|uniref:non-specific serine/threonine protein kinase n=1 Tax=Carassius auratus TaxID=7957 RepID=A0A6P6R2P5_CARAU|nr:phosphoinositide 3-kinase regulatory subunit 4-like isoform X1 [Carassius auratus]XP_026139559.1 phosphoinositide 3-kinase regulatory subunit 4-like isoform X1 [Carassius auratus]XP_052435659.1 phosphoinositide 3-kinase regulatory subunit 4 isoform X1 [Carassius gibelio]XP_052435661.1 phosphoinositide 3-kinase regulatory subunit 4 isoform X1 [Carassius gibelio]XP_052435662.1 phosphoinositide 3-kinase regulatory subunit 4 isoform X1 [Carassius gibelio]